MLLRWSLFLFTTHAQLFLSVSLSLIPFIHITFLFLLLYYHHVPSSYFSSYDSHQATGDKIVIVHWNEDQLLLLQTRRTGYILRDLPIWSPKIRTLCLVHRLLLLYQNLGDLLIPTVIKERLWSTGCDKALCERLQAAFA